MNNAMAAKNTIGRLEMAKDINGGESITAGVLASAMVSVGIWIAKAAWGIEIPATLAGPLTTIVTALGIALWWLARRVGAGRR